MKRYLKSERVFTEFYPKRLEKDNRFYKTKKHNILSKGFKHIGHLDFLYGIESPSVEDNKRFYNMSFGGDIINTSCITNQEDFFRGIIGEKIMRIVMIEFLRRMQQQLGIKRFNIVKGNYNPKNPITNIVKNFEYSAETISRYNIAIKNNNMDDKRIPIITEYDGLIKYVYETIDKKEKNGLIVCESKTGSLDYLSATKSVEGLNKIRNRIILPLKSLFPDYDIDYVLMGTKENIMNPKNSSKRIIANSIRPSLSELYLFLKEHEIGFIPLLFPESRHIIKATANKIKNIKEALPEGDNSLERIIEEGKNQTYIESNGHKYLINKNKIIEILRKTDDNTYTIIFSLK